MQARLSADTKPLILSLFSGCGGLDLGFEQVGFGTALAYDLRKAAIASHNHNRTGNRAHTRDITELGLADLDKDFGGRFDPVGVIGGPPCQSFSRGNSHKRKGDPRTKLIRKFFNLALRLHRRRSGLDFIVMENVPEIEKAQNGRLLKAEILRLEESGFHVSLERVNAVDYGVGQSRKRTILVALNKQRMLGNWSGPKKIRKIKTVRNVIFGLQEPVYFSEAHRQDIFAEHRNHWCMTPKSSKFFDGSLKPGRSSGRSFKTLSWDRPSYTVSYGHREVHVHPDCHRRLSVYEAMLLQGFPKRFELLGTLSDQISQISEAVPPPLAKAVAEAILNAMDHENLSSNSVKAAA